jgi:hypothetical protein
MALVKLRRKINGEKSGGDPALWLYVSIVRAVRRGGLSGISIRQGD